MDNSNLSDKQILNALYLREEDLKNEIKAHNIQINELQRQLVAVYNAIKGFGGDIANIDTNNVDNISIPVSYSHNLTILEKILFILNERGECSVSQILEEINKKEPTTNKDNMHKSVTLIASSLYRADKIKARKDGVKNFYSLRS